MKSRNRLRFPAAFLAEGIAVEARSREAATAGQVFGCKDQAPPAFGEVFEAGHQEAWPPSCMSALGR